MSPVALRVPGNIKASKSGFSQSMSSKISIILSPTSSSYSKGSMSVKFAILGSLMTPIVISLPASNL